MRDFQNRLNLGDEMNYTHLMFDGDGGCPAYTKKPYARGFFQSIALRKSPGVKNFSVIDLSIK